MKRRLSTLVLATVLLVSATPARADEPGALSRPFKKSLVTRMVDCIYEAAGGQDTIPLSDSAKSRFKELDADKNGSLSRFELADAMLNAKLRLSLKGADTKLTMKVVNVIDAEDGIQGGQIRVRGNMMESKDAAKNLESGAWTVGDGFFEKVDGVPVLELKKGSFTLP